MMQMVNYTRNLQLLKIQYKALDKPIEITIKDTDKTQNFTINNEALVEKTAMDKEQLTIIIASVFMICGLGLVLYYGYKKQA